MKPVGMDVHILNHLRLMQPCEDCPDPVHHVRWQLPGVILLKKSFQPPMPETDYHISTVACSASLVNVLISALRIYEQLPPVPLPLRGIGPLTLRRRSGRRVQAEVELYHPAHPLRYCTRPPRACQGRLLSRRTRPFPHGCHFLLGARRDLLRVAPSGDHGGAQRE